MFIYVERHDEKVEMVKRLVAAGKFSLEDIAVETGLTILKVK